MASLCVNAMPSTMQFPGLAEDTYGTKSWRRIPRPGRPEMPRTPRVTAPGAVYHVTARGNGDEMIFAADENKRLLLQTLGAVATERTWDVLAYCVMGNHYHLVARTPLQNLSEGMHALNGCYGEMYNRRHGHRGHVFQGRFFSIAFTSDGHLLEACRYTVLNPVRAGLVTSPLAWPWSSYTASALGSRGPVPVADGMLLAMLDTRGANYSRDAYRTFVAEGIGLPKPHCLQRQREGRPRSTVEVDPEVRQQWKPDDLSMQVSRLRSQGRTLRDIAGMLGVSAMTVSRHLKRHSTDHSM